MYSESLTLNNYCNILRKMMPLPLIQFEVNLVNHCNLNCKSCDHISPLAEHWYADVELFEKNMQRMSSVFNGEARYIRLVGGEPLLHSQITEFLTIARKYFGSASIEIWTNGILLSSMQSNFWRGCEENSICINVTKYPISFDYDPLKHIAEKNGVKLTFFDNGRTVKTFNNNSYDPSGICEPRASFIACPNANRHITLTQCGKLFTCDKPPHVEILNKYFKTNFFVSPNDYIDIYSDLSAKDIFEFLSKPIPFCRYCNISKRMQDVAWERSDKALGEWVLD